MTGVEGVEGEEEIFWIRRERRGVEDAESMADSYNMNEYPRSRCFVVAQN